MSSSRTKRDLALDLFVGSVAGFASLVLISFGVEFYRSWDRFDQSQENRELRRQVTELRAELDARRRGELKPDGLPRIPPQNLPLE